MPVTPSIYNSTDNAVVQWVGETGTGIGAPCSEWEHKTVQVTGPGATVAIEGSSDGLVWVPLNDAHLAAKTPISLVVGTNNIARIAENPIFIRPVVSGATATVTLTCNT